MEPYDYFHAKIKVCYISGPHSGDYKGYDLLISERGRRFGGIYHSACLVLLVVFLLGLLFEPDVKTISTSE
jgi:hypothetical protein